MSILSQWRIEPETLEAIWPKKEGLVLVKCRDHISIYTVNSEPLFFQHFDEAFFPILRVLHKCHLCFSRLQNAGYPLQGPTICYMPHCDMELYNDLFRANWSQGQILKLVLLANHLEEYLENNPHHKLQERVPYLFKITPVLDGHPLPPSKAWPTAFNNTSLQHICLPYSLSNNWFSGAPDQTQETHGS
ncbi:Translation machinery-associated protein 20 [Leucoagaricus sp. SymC.cos]|nr:Translation machinery-associated protein 20 [Leucoagaricus sp. SymC.cos]